MTGKRKTLLVTGSPRSGTTFVGRMLAASPDLHYVHEPFNPDTRAREDRGRLQFERHFTYVTDENAGSYRDDLRRVFEGRYDTGFWLRSIRSPRQLRRVLSTRRRFAERRARGVVPLIKDPIALMSAGWLADEFDLDCVVTIRHPGAFVASINRLEWNSKPFRWTLSQPLLMRDVFQPFEEELHALETEGADVVERAAMAWKLHHYVIKGYRERYPDWTFVRHEDISLAPLEQFQMLYERLSLTWTPAVEQAILEHTSEENPDQSVGKEKSLQLNSRAHIGSWKKHLKDEEIERVRARVSGVVEAFYDDSQW